MPLGSQVVAFLAQSLQGSALTSNIPVDYDWGQSWSVLSPARKSFNPCCFFIFPPAFWRYDLPVSQPVQGRWQFSIGCFIRQNLPAAKLPSRAKIPGDLAALAILALHGRVAPWNKRVQWERHLLLPLAEPEQPFSFLVGSAQGFHRQFFPRRRESPWHAAYINGFIESALSLEAEPLASTPASSSSSSSSG